MTFEARSPVTRVVLGAVTKLFGPTPVLRGVSASFEPGAVTVLLGENGAGKSTLLGLVGTRLRPTRGEVHYETTGGRLLERPEVRAELGWVSHETMAYRELTGLENVRLVAELQGVDADAVEAIRTRTGLGKFAERPLSTLSRGQRQRVALARALVHAPSLLLLDEPWTGLDLGASRDLERIVLEERERGAIVVIVSHDPALAARLDARVLTLRGGRLEAEPRDTP